MWDGLGFWKLGLVIFVGRGIRGRGSVDVGKTSESLDTVTEFNEFDFWRIS